MPPLLSPPSLDFEYTLGSQMILLALFTALHYPVLARAVCTLVDGALSRERSDFYRFGYATLEFALVSKTNQRAERL
jgi:hypothetical protein